MEKNMKNIEKLCKSTSKETKCKKAIAIIRSGGTWEDVERETGVTRAYIQKLLRGYYKHTGSYNNLLKKARENMKASPVTDNIIVIAETSAFIANPNLLRRKEIVYVPAFCKHELTKISEKNGIDYSKVLNSSKIHWITVEGKYRINNKPNELIKPRILGIVSLCCDMAKTGRKIRLFTASSKLAQIAEIQNIDIDIRHITE